MARPNNGHGVVYGLALAVPIWVILLILALWMYFVPEVK